MAVCRGHYCSRARGLVALNPGQDHLRVAFKRSRYHLKSWPQPQSKEISGGAIRGCCQFPRNAALRLSDSPSSNRDCKTQQQTVVATDIYWSTAINGRKVILEKGSWLNSFTDHQTAALLAIMGRIPNTLKLVFNVVLSEFDFCFFANSLVTLV